MFSITTWSRGGIIGEIQWVLPLEYYEPGEEAKCLSAHNLMIHCDQRYTEEDMRYVADRASCLFLIGSVVTLSR